MPDLSLNQCKLTRPNMLLKFARNNHKMHVALPDMWSLFYFNFDNYGYFNICGVSDLFIFYFSDIVNSQVT